MTKKYAESRYSGTIVNFECSFSKIVGAKENHQSKND